MPAEWREIKSEKRWEIANYIDNAKRPTSLMGDTLWSVESLKCLENPEVIGYVGTETYVEKVDDISDEEENDDEIWNDDKGGVGE
eukprot:2744370-Ditylum_brightwellii.AAC.1